MKTAHSYQGVITMVLLCFLLASSFIPHARAGTTKTEITMEEGVVKVGGVPLEANQELELGGLLVRAKDLKAGGRSLLLKGDSKEAIVFGREVKLGEGGQYQVKWNPGEMMIDTASVSATFTPKNWTAGEELFEWFSGNETREGQKAARRVSFDRGSDDRLPEPRGLPLPRGGARAVDELQYSFTPETDARSGAEATVVDLTNLPQGGSEGEYVIQPGDTVDLSFYRIQRVTVDLKGDIRVASSVGSAESVIKAAGKTPKEIAKAVMDSGLNFRSVVDPALKVSVAKFADRSIVVLGAVKKPGKIPLEEGEIIGVPGVLKKAGGVTGNETSSVVYVKRGDRITKADLGDSDKEALNLFKIMPGDIITVNKK